jgi:hypothetical protein
LRINTSDKMPHAWYVTFDVQKSGPLPKRRSPRVTRTFETEIEAKNFARAKFNEGLVVYAGTLNPYLPKQLIPSSTIPLWLEGLQQREAEELEDAQEKENDADGGA